ncbi:SseB family protein [Methanobrevibacter sp.]|uniref:SseB family protein n=1 Tax=Methanobrevibacter sp. TaxID=66852 RepID=UPI00386D00FF
MRKHFVKHDNLRKCLEEIAQKREDVDETILRRLLAELKHSNLIIAGEITESSNMLAVCEDEGKRYGFLFTDMHEFRKFVPQGECECETYDFEFYKKMVGLGVTDGFILNPESEGFIIIREVFDIIKHLPQHEYIPENPYTKSELKLIKDSIDNGMLEDFIRDSANLGNYEELFDEISHSTLLTLMLSRDDLSEYAEGGVISMEDTGPLGFLYLDEIGGQYATVYTSEDEMEGVATEYNRYSQIVNFSQMANFILNDDMDGIIINPNSQNILISRDVLLEFSSLLERLCNDSRLNTAIMHMFPIEEEA